MIELFQKTLEKIGAENIIVDKTVENNIIQEVRILFDLEEIRFILYLDNIQNEQDLHNSTALLSIWF